MPVMRSCGIHIDTLVKQSKIRQCTIAENLRLIEERLWNTIGETMREGSTKAKTVHFVFPTKDLAELNYDNLKARQAHKVFFLEQRSDQAIRCVELQ